METTMINDSPNTLIITGAFYHPNSEVRNRLRKVVGLWAQAQKPKYSAGEIRELILNETGTPLEPFSLEKTDVEAAVFITNVAFSEKINATRIRIVSRETIGYKGGLVITSNFRHYYAERYALGKYKRNPQTGISFFPAYAPSSDKSLPVWLNAIRASLLTDDKGFIIRLPWPYIEKDPGVIARRLQKNSRLEPGSISFDKIGLRVDVTESNIEIRTGSPEAQIKFAAHMMNKATIHLVTEGAYPMVPDAYIVLDMPDRARTSLKTVFVSSGKVCHWMKFEHESPISVSKEDKLAISKWLPPHPTWIDEIWDELT